MVVNARIAANAEVDAVLQAMTRIST
jgi:hypothetical protein